MFLQEDLHGDQQGSDEVLGKADAHSLTFSESCRVASRWGLRYLGAVSAISTNDLSTKSSPW